MDAVSVVEAWDRSLRDGDWDRARSLLADDATYLGSEDLEADFNCENADQIVDLMRSWKGKHGQQFLTAVRERFGPGGLFLMDEPESALSFTSQLALLRVMHEYSASGSQFIVATHSPILLAFPEATIWHLDGEGMRRGGMGRRPSGYRHQSFPSRSGALSPLPVLR